MAKRKMTPFARLFLVLIIIIPLSFFAASYINNENPIENFEELTGIEVQQGQDNGQATELDDKKPGSLADENEALKKEIEDLRKQLSDCKTGASE